MRERRNVPVTPAHSTTSDHLRHITVVAKPLVRPVGHHEDITRDVLVGRTVELVADDVSGLVDAALRHASQFLAQNTIREGTDILGIERLSAQSRQQLGS